MRFPLLFSRNHAREACVRIVIDVFTKRQECAGNPA
jgi:hypothetical protein